MLLPLVNINQKTSKGTAMHIAIKKKAKGMIAMLANLKPDLTLFYYKKNTLFYIFIINSIRDKDNKTPLELCRDADILLLLESPPVSVCKD